MENNTEEQLTLFAGDSPAKTCQPQESKQASMATVQDYTGKCCESLASVCRDTQFLKMSQVSFLESQEDGLLNFSMTWPRSGTMQNGTVYLLRILGAKHHRDRVWIIAYASSNDGYASENETSGEQREKSTLFNSAKSSNHVAHASIKHDGIGKPESIEGQKPEPGDSVSKSKISAYAYAKRCERFAKVAKLLKQQVEFMRSSQDFTRRFDLSEPPLRGANDGVPRRLDRLRRLGNAVVPQIPEAIGRAILEAEAA